MPAATETATPTPESPTGGGLSRVTGTITYRERIGLTANAVVEVQLRDISLADAPSVLIAEQVIESPGQVPIAFEVEYDPARIDQRRDYSIQASIIEDGRLLFINDTVYSVITGGHPSQIDMVLVIVP